MYGITFKVVSDHKTLSSASKTNRGKKTISSKQTRIIPFDFTTSPRNSKWFCGLSVETPERAKWKIVRIEEIGITVSR